METLLQGLRAASEPTRLRILSACAQGELTVSELTEVLGQSQPRVSRHLKLLCEGGLLDRYREGSWVFYRLAERGTGGDIVRAISALLPLEDDLLKADSLRLDAIKRERMGRAQAYFRANASIWNQVRSLYVDESEVEAVLIKAFGERDIENFLDIGTGTGRVLEVFGPRVGRGVGIDVSHEMLTYARANLEKAGLSNCQVRQGDMYRLPFGDESMDAVVIHMVLHYADEPSAVIEEAARVLRRNGRLVVVDFAPHNEEALREHHAHRRLGFSDDEVADWYGAAGLAPEPPVRLPGSPLTVMVWAAGRAEDARNEHD